MASEVSQSVLFLVPGDPGQRTGGYRYVSQLVKALTVKGWKASVEGLGGQFPVPDAVAESAMDQRLSDCENGATVVLDGLAMGGLPAVVEKHATRLTLVALVHHPLADETGIRDDHKTFLFESEIRALAAVSRVITTSHHTARRLSDFNVAPDIIHVIEPGTDRSPSPAKPAGQGPEQSELRLLCVAGLSPRKAQHQLVQALSALTHLPWHCALAGSTERNPEYSQQVVDQIQSLSLEGRITLSGELDEQALLDHYRSADLFVLPSLYEGYGMVIDEALAAGLPVITTDGGALANTGNRPGVRQYPAGSVDDLRDCLNAYLSDRQMLQGLTDAARHTSRSIRQWSEAAEEFTAAMAQSPQVKDHSQFDQQWLRLREPADHRARNKALLEQVQLWLNSLEVAGPGLRITDLGAGAGSNGVYLGDKLHGPQRWTLLDQDPDLLAEACQRLETGVVAVEARECTLEAGNLNELIPADTQLITASALIDLASTDWLDALSDAAKNRQAAVFIVLSYAGEFQLTPEHPDDDLLRSLVNDHQHGDKGSGAALGPEATGYLKDQLQSRGFKVTVAPSPWLLEGEDYPLQAALMSGWCEAAKEQCPAERTRIEQWQAARLTLAKQGALAIRVAHHDLFARPGHD